MQRPLMAPLYVKRAAVWGVVSFGYHPGTDTYTYIWKTDKTWKNTCRTLFLDLNDGTRHQARFQFS